MRESPEDLASWATIFGTGLTLLGMVQSQSWLTVLGAFSMGFALIAFIYYRRGRLILTSAGINIEGHHLDSLNIANLRRRLNRSLTVQKAYHLAKIEGQDLTVAWQYNGYCKSEKETSMEFSIDSENNVAFAQLDCFAYDLQEDPLRLHRIQPMLVGSDGMSKKVAVPLLKPLVREEPFSVLLNCTLPNCLGTGVQYYTSTLSFDQRQVKQLAVHLVFVRRPPDWLRVYECDKRGLPHLINDLRPFKNDGETCEYIDLCENVGGQNVRIYVFHFGDRSAGLPHASTAITSRRKALSRG